MVVTEIVDDARARRGAVWADPLPPASATEVRYGNEADELVARWDGFVPVSAVSMFFEHPGIEAVGVIVDWATGQVVGIHVCPLLHRATRRYPHWGSLAHPNPPAEAVSALVADVRALFDRYGVDLDDPEAP